MGWINKSIMDQKTMFIELWLSEAFTMSSLCERFEISRTTGYNLVNRYLENGDDWLLPRSKSPKNIPHKTPEKIEKAVVRLRKKHSNWGARKFKVLLENEFTDQKIPSETTINAILRRHDLIKTRRKRFPKQEKVYPKFDPKVCNEIWSADYKGRFRLGNLRYCNPLTICDSKSRKIIAIDCHYKTSYKSVKQAYTRAFKDYGKPLFMHTDNGIPFASMNSAKRFSRLCYWLIDHGITPLFSDPGCPQQNGRHERMHRDLKQFCYMNKIKNTLSKQQKVMDEFRKEYNSIRPHEAIKMKTPDSVHTKSSRKYSEKIVKPDYPNDYKVRKVCKNGAIRWRGYYWIFISGAAAGRFVGTKEVGHGVFQVYYRDHLLGYFDEKQLNKKGMYLNLTKLKV